MQGRANKAPKKELVIESPQQYKRSVAAEPEVEPVPQVVVSDSSNWHGDHHSFWFMFGRAVLASQNRSDPQESKSCKG